MLYYEKYREVIEKTAFDIFNEMSSESFKPDFQKRLKNLKECCRDFLKREEVNPLDFNIFLNSILKVITAFETHCSSKTLKVLINSLRIGA